MVTNIFQTFLLKNLNNVLRTATGTRMRTKYLFLLPLLAAFAITTLPVFASTGMGGDPPGQGIDNPQPDRVGADDGKVERDGPDEGSEDANCWGKVTSDVVNAEDDGDSIGGQTFGQHAANPTGDDDNDTPREGVGNQDEDHPSDHADSVGARFGSDEGCAQD
jgi:hypothetical protein